RSRRCSAPSPPLPITSVLASSSPCFSARRARHDHSPSKSFGLPLVLRQGDGAVGGEADALLLQALTLRHGCDAPAAALADAAARIDDAVPGQAVADGQRAQCVADQACLARQAGELGNLTVGRHAPLRYLEI